MSRQEDILREALVEAKQKLNEQKELIEQLLDAPTVQGYVVWTDGQRVQVSVADGIIEVKYPSADVNGSSLAKRIKIGALVRCAMGQGAAIIDVIDPAVGGGVGELVLVTKEISTSMIEVEYGGGPHRIRYPADLKKPETGDRVMIDSNCHAAIHNYGPDESKFSFQGSTGVSWDDIGGLHEAKEIMQEAVELPIKHAELYKKYGKKPVKGILLYGPPGCGKTMLAKATATSLATMHGKKTVDTGFIYVKGPEMLDKWVGNTEAQIRSLFARARKHHTKHGYPAVIFIDEAEALLSKRGEKANHILNSTTVPQFLAEMDGLEETGAIVLLATNRPDVLDSAVTRDGRIDLKARVSRPNQKEAEEIFKLYLKNRLIADDSNIDSLSELASSYLFNTDYQYYSVLDKSGVAHAFTLSSMVNGAMIAGMVEKAATLALRRDMQSQSQKPGILAEDLAEAAKALFKQNLHLNHEEEMQDFIANSKLSPDQIFRIAP